MKTGIALFALLTVVISVQAQEYDDMYFRSKDRAKVNSERVSMTSSSQTYNQDETVQSTINPTDSYSGRGTNPEYTSRTKLTGTSNSDEDAQYFVSGYQPTNVNQSLTAYNNGSFYSPYYGNSAFSNSYYGYGSGFGYPYSSFYSPYSSFYSPYSYMSYGMGSMWGMGMGSGFYSGMGLGFGSMWGSPYYSMMYGGYYGGYGYPYYGYGYGMGYGGYYPAVVINSGNDGNGYTTGKRTSRSSGLNNQMYNSNRSNNTIVDSHGRTRGAAANGLTTTSTNGRSSGTSQYYHSGWRSNPDVQRNIGGSNAGRSSSWGNSSGWGNTSGRSSSTWGGNSNSGFNNSGSFGGSRSSGGFSGGSFGGGGHMGGGGGGGRGRH